MVQQNGAPELESINFFLYRLFTVINFAICCLILKSFKCIQIKPSIKTVLKYYTVFRTKSAVLPARVRVLAVVQCLCLAGCLSESESLTSRCSIKTAERIELVFGTGASFDLSYTVFSRHLGTSR